MSKNKLNLWSAEQKTKIILQLLKEDKPINVLAKEYSVSPKTIQNWKKQFLANAQLAFSPEIIIKEHKKEIQELKNQNDRLAKTLGKTTVERDWAVEKLKGLDLLNKKDLIDSKPKKLSIKAQCELLEVNRSSSYYTPKEPSKTKINIMNNIDEIYTDNPSYGYRYIHQKLLEDKISIGKERVLKYMQIMGIQAIYPHKKKNTSIKDNEHKTHKYLLKDYWIKSKDGKNKTLTKIPPNEIWSGDITYIRMNGGFMYLAAIIDWHSKAILSYKISNSTDESLVTEVLQDALSKNPKPKIFNSDQGSQYTGKKHIKMLKDNGITISMNGEGRSIDNIIIERFFRTLKYDCIFINDFRSVKDLKRGVAKFMHHYNYLRFHSSINYRKPMNLYLESFKKAA